MSDKVIIKTIKLDLAEANRAYKVSDVSIKTPTFTLHSPSTNGGVIYKGDEDVNATDNIPRQIGSTITYSASLRGDFSSGDYFDLSDIYVLAANAGDDVIVEYYAKAVGT